MLDTIDFRERGLAVLLMRWTNLGASIDSADAKWKSHITISVARSVHHPHHPGDIRTGFEDQAEVSMEELTTDNKLKLLSRRQNRLVYRGSDGLVWKWDQDKWWYLAPSGPPQTCFWNPLIGLVGVGGSRFLVTSGMSKSQAEPPSVRWCQLRTLSSLSV